MQIFIDESIEHLQSCFEQLLKLEKEPENKMIVNEIFRSAHTIKGMAAAMDFKDLTSLTHQMENVLEDIREEKITIDNHVLEGLLFAVEELEGIIQSIMNGDEGKKDVTEAINRLIKIGTDKKPKPSPKSGEYDPSEIIPNKKKAVIDQTIRVKAERLDTLMGLFEGMVIHRGRLEQISRELDHQELSETVEYLGRVTNEMQNVLLNIRMVPIRMVFNRFQRMIRQLAKDLNKLIHIEIIGADTELDRSLLDEIVDPLVHILRNALDHGIESPEDRLAADKPAVGNLTLKAYQSGNNVYVEVSDDGRGIDKQKVIDSALKKGLITIDDAISLSENEVFNLLFMTGFSTAVKISDISGRGIGLDVAKYKIESFGGTLSIESQLGSGTTFLLKLPLTLSILSVLLIQVQTEKYAIPISCIVETVVVQRNNIWEDGGQMVFQFRERVVPLIFLKEALNIPGDRNESQSYCTIVVQKGEITVGLIVDTFIEHQEVVVKSLGKYLPYTPGISGATLLGDGQLALILDCPAILKKMVNLL